MVHKFILVWFAQVMRTCVSIIFITQICLLILLWKNQIIFLFWHCWFLGIYDMCYKHVHFLLSAELALIFVSAAIG